MKKGFTLIELLAVIVILAIISLIAVPIIGSIIESSKRKAAIETARNYIDSLDDKLSLMYVDNGVEVEPGVYVVTTEPIGEFSSINEYVDMTGKLPDSGIVNINKKTKVDYSTLCIGKYLVKYEKDEYKIDGNCIEDGDNESFDFTVIALPTSGKINVVVASSSEISSYCYSIDGNECVKSTSPKYTFNNLEINKEYTIKITAYNNTGFSKEVTRKVTTTELTPPEIVVDKKRGTSKIIEINYPTVKNENFKYEYSFDMVNWKVSNSYNKKIKFTTNGYVVARVTDETGNKISSNVMNISGIDTTTTGTIITYVSKNEEDNNNMKDGYLLCDGRAVSRTTYANLFKVIGTTYGSGNGSSTFNLPNYDGKTVVGLNSSDTSFASLGKTGGEKKHALNVTELPSHSHTFTGTSHTHTFTGTKETSGTVSADHVHSIPAHTHTVPAVAANSGIQYANNSPYSHSHYTNYRNTGSEAGGYGLSPGASAFYDRLTVSGGAYYASSNGNHAHIFGINASTTGGPSTTTSAESAVHSHSVTGAGNNSSDKIKGTISNTGSSEGHNNLQPYVVNVYYIKY